MLFRQFFDPISATFTYLIAAGENTPAAIIDPVIEHTDLYVNYINELNLQLKYTIETHTHADHITASGKLSKVLDCDIVAGSPSKATAVTKRVNDGDTLEIGTLHLKAIATPGHTDDSFSYYLEQTPGYLFTGDTLFIRGSGRTDFQSGNAEMQYDSITNKLFCFTDDTHVYPGHDYKTLNVSTIGEEKRFNPRLSGKSKQQYVEIMNSLNLPYPKKIDSALPANLTCGLMEN